MKRVFWLLAFLPNFLLLSGVRAQEVEFSRPDISNVIDEAILEHREMWREQRDYIEHWFERDGLAGHQVEYIGSGVPLLEKRLEVINKAKRSVYLSTFIYDPDISPRQIGYALCEAAKRGVEVRMLLDGFGGKQFYRDYAETLRECGIGIMLYNPISWGLSKVHHVIHEKLLIVDGRETMMGGNGVGDAYHKNAKAKKYYHDQDIWFAGPAACHYHQLFQKNWQVYLKKEIKSLKRHLAFYEQDYLYGAPFEKDCTPEVMGNSRVLPLYHNPQFEKSKPLYAAYVTALAWAKKEIVIYAPYFVPHDKMVEAMKIALMRGIKIRVITNSIESNDEGFHTLVGMLYKIGPLLKLGMEVKLFKGPNTMHRKGSLWDQQLAAFGSDNWDARGHFYQSESMMFTDDQATVLRMQQEIAQDMQNSWTLDQAYAKRIWSGTNKLKRFLIRRLLKQL